MPEAERPREISIRGYHQAILLHLQSLRMFT